jgi:predicted transcriptional regulator
MSLKEMQSLINIPRISADSLMRCALGVRKTEIETYCILLTRGPSTVQEVASVLNKSRSNAQRILQGLVEKGLAIREDQLMGLGGYKYIYSAISAKQLREAIAIKLREWYKKMMAELEELPIKLEEIGIICSKKIL